MSDAKAWTQGPELPAAPPELPVPLLDPAAFRLWRLASSTSHSSSILKGLLGETPLPRREQVVGVGHVVLEGRRPCANKLVHVGLGPYLLLLLLPRPALACIWVRRQPCRHRCRGDHCRYCIVLVCEVSDSQCEKVLSIL